MSEFKPNQVSEDVLPGFPADHLTDSNSTDSEPASEFGICRSSSQTSDLDNVGASELGGTSSFTFCHPAPVNGVSGVLGVGSEHKVTGLDATRSVTGMSHDHSVWYLSVVDTVRENVCSKLLAFKPRLPVSDTCESMGPVPAPRLRGLLGHEVDEQFPYREPPWPEFLERSTGERVSELLHPSVVVVAQPLSKVLVGTPSYGTDSIRAGHVWDYTLFPRKVAAL